MKARRALWALIAVILIVGGFMNLVVGGPEECGWDEVAHTNGGCVPCPSEATPETPCSGLIGDDL
ncbi:MAG: hypothetical protein HKN91_17890 [Acidimicrobiia bacterium]|nr:hypothetical protein [Acidimicrobiia bacterium]